MKGYLFTILTASIGLVSCSNGSVGNFSPAQPSVVPESPSESIITWSKDNDLKNEGFHSNETVEIKYIFLQLDNPKSVVGTVNQIFANGEKITVVDLQNTEKIVQFDYNGKYIRSIGSKGRARGEYLGIGCVDISDTGDIWLIDNIGGKLIKYSSDGTFQEEFKFDVMLPQSIIVSDSTFIGSYAGYLKSSPFRLKKCSINGQVIDTAFPYTSIRSYTAGRLLRDTDGKAYYNFPMNDTIYKIDGNRIVPEIIMNVYDADATNKFLKETESLDERNFKERLYQSEEVVNLAEAIKCNDTWFVYWQKGTDTAVSLISDNGKSKVNYRRSKLNKERNSGDLYLAEHFVDYTDNSLVGYIDPVAFAYLDKNIKAEYLKRIREHSMNAPEDDTEIVSNGNPILFMYKLKSDK